MTYSIYQHWDPLKVCAVGRSYSPEFYRFIKNTSVRDVFERIAEETEQDYQKLITLLESFGVEVIRPRVTDDYSMYIDPKTNKILPPPMTPRDYSVMLGEDFYFKNRSDPIAIAWDKIKGSDWPAYPGRHHLHQLPATIINELTAFGLDPNTVLIDAIDQFTWKDLLTNVRAAGNPINRIDHPHLYHLNSAQYTRIGRDVYVGTEEYGQDKTSQIDWLNKNQLDYRWHKIDTGGHSDSTFCPVKPGLIVSLHDIPTYAETFPEWEVVYLPGQSWDSVQPFLDLKHKNQGKWWVPGEEFNDDFTDFVNQWVSHWVGYVEETVFDVNMLVIDQKNVICNNYNAQVFEAFDRHGITAHIINFRHRYFWDGGLHCITSDISRTGTMQDYFPQRG